MNISGVLNTSEGIMCGLVHRGVFSTLGEIMSISGVLNTSEGTISASGRGIS